MSLASSVPASMPWTGQASSGDQLFDFGLISTRVPSSRGDKLLVAAKDGRNPSKKPEASRGFWSERVEAQASGCRMSREAGTPSTDLERFKGLRLSGGGGGAEQ